MHTIELLQEELRKRKPGRVAILTGAGVSAESGIPTFRGPQGLWKNFRPEELATPGAFARDPRLVWEWYEWRRGLVRAAKPNAAHEAIAMLEARRPGMVSVVTQNVDGLHARAGSKTIFELHGNLFQSRCVREGTSIDDGTTPRTELPPRCSCGSLLRPGVVWFGEMLPPMTLQEAAIRAENADLLLVVGTSAVVHPAAGLATLCRGLTVEINPDETAISERMDFTLRLSAVSGVPSIVATLLEE